MSETLTITVLFYDNEFLLELKSELIQNCSMADSGRVVIPEAFKEGKLIVAVLEGAVRVLNKLGDRALPVPYIA